MQSSKIDRIKDLVEQLNAASESYYAKDQEIMSNYEYDKLYDELVELEKETGVTLANSPTVNVGYEAVDELPKERHESPMLSLGKTKRPGRTAGLAARQSCNSQLETGRADHCIDVS